MRINLLIGLFVVIYCNADYQYSNENLIGTDSAEFRIKSGIKNTKCQWGWKVEKNLNFVGFWVDIQQLIRHYSLIIGRFATKEYATDEVTVVTKRPERGQSPINIQNNSTIIDFLPPLLIRGLLAPTFTKLMNTGETIKAKIKSDATLSGGPLKYIYTFDQMHFHWGENNTEGSEHTINSKKYPLEAHFVFSRKDQEGKALNITVIGLMFEINKFSPFYNIFPFITNVLKANSEIYIDRNLFVDFKYAFKPTNYYTYSGSLTTPPYTEGVTWIVYKEPLRINKHQMEVFRQVMGAEGPILKNWRNVQKLDNRTVRFIQLSKPFNHAC